VLTSDELVEVRAAQRTFEGAYVRTALGQFSFSIIVLRIFTSDILVASLFRRQQGNKQFFSEVGEDGLNQRRFRTSGNIVVVLTALSVGAYIALLVLTMKLGPT